MAPIRKISRRSWAAGASTAPGSPHPDEMGYTLAIAADDGTHELAGTDASATTEFARLVKQVKSRGKAETV